MSKIKVDYINHMGDDLTVVNAARVSFDARSEWDYAYETMPSRSGKTLKEKDHKLIRYLAKHNHISPFGHCFLSVRVTAPIFVARQLVKHQYLRWNEISRRYVNTPPEFYVPDTWRERSEDKKQGSGKPLFDDSYVGSKDYNQILLEAYQGLIDSDICPEQARMILPQSMMTSWYWSGSLDAFTNMLNLRLPEDTQYESRLVAQQVHEVMKPLFPLSVKELVKV